MYWLMSAHINAKYIIEIQFRQFGAKRCCFFLPQKDKYYSDNYAANPTQNVGMPEEMENKYLVISIDPLLCIVSVINQLFWFEP